jgi:glucokinase
MILAGDIGSETTSLALFTAEKGDLHLLRSATVANDEFPALRTVLRRFVAQDLSVLRGACFALTGAPPWPVEAPEVAAALGLPAAEAEVIGAAEAAAEHQQGGPLERAPSPLLGAAWRAARRGAAVGEGA